MADSSIPATTSKPQTLRVFLIAGRIVLGVVFVYAAYTKLRVPWMLFAMSIDSYRILPAWSTQLLARGLPWVELSLGVLLIIGIGLRWVAAAAAALLLVFFSSMVRAQAHGLGIDCGCFGIGEKLGPRTLIRDGLLLALALAVALGAFISARSSAGPRRSVG